MNFTYVCGDCGREYSSEQLRYRCPACADDTAGFQAGNLSVRISEEDLLTLGARNSVNPLDFLPYPIPTPEAFPVGNTPLAASPRLSRRWNLSNLRFKLDGSNPSGSFKDRASQLVAAQALFYSERRVVVASTGNAGSSMACAGAAYGLEVILFVPSSAPMNKLMQSVLYGARVVPVEGSYDDAFALSLAYSREAGGINRNTAYNPMTIEGKKSVSLELYNQLGGRAPDAVFIPVGDGVIISGVSKGFEDLKRAGLIPAVPKLIAVQAEGSAAIAAAAASGRQQVLSGVRTIADSISVASPAGGRTALSALSSSAGWAVVVSDEQILAAQLELAAEAGIFVEPAAAAAWAGVRSDSDRIRRELGADAEVTVLLTGTGFKDMAVFSGRVSVPKPIKPDLESAFAFLETSRPGV